jgi:hypothetical protein
MHAWKLFLKYYDMKVRTKETNETHPRYVTRPGPGLKYRTDELYLLHLVLQ